jgi:hypothetical protein
MIWKKTGLFRHERILMTDLGRAVCKKLRGFLLGFALQPNISGLSGPLQKKRGCESAYIGRSQNKKPVGRDFLS